PFLSGCRAARFLAKNGERAAQRHAGREQAREQPGKILQLLGSDLLRVELEGKVLGARLGPRFGRAILRRGAFGRAHRPQSASLDLPKGVRASGRFQLTFRDRAIGLKRSILKSGHSYSWTEQSN